MIHFYTDIWEQQCYNMHQTCRYDHHVNTTTEQIPNPLYLELSVKANTTQILLRNAMMQTGGQG